jgi:hypothetical protein
LISAPREHEESFSTGSTFTTASGYHEKLSFSLSLSVALAFSLLDV